MNGHFAAYIELGQLLAHERGLSWDIPIDKDGMAQDGIGWNLTDLIKDTAGVKLLLRNFSVDVVV